MTPSPPQCDLDLQPGPTLLLTQVKTAMLACLGTGVDRIGTTLQPVVVVEATRLLLAEQGIEAKGTVNSAQFFLQNTWQEGDTYGLSTPEGVVGVLGHVGWPAILQSVADPTGHPFKPSVHTWGEEFEDEGGNKYDLDDVAYFLALDDTLLAQANSLVPIARASIEAARLQVATAMPSTHLPRRSL